MSKYTQELQHEYLENIKIDKQKVAKIGSYMCLPDFFISIFLFC